jgi:hypothetical protein
MDVAAAIAALVAIGVNPALAASMVAHWAAEKAARRVDVFGVLTTRDKAILLKEKVAATKEAVIKKQMSPEAATLALQSYGIPQANINALISEWAAQAYKLILPP